MARISEDTGALATRIVAMAITAGVGMASFALSFAALRDLAVRGHVPVGQAWLWPLVVDGTIMLATMGVIVMTAHPGNPAKRFFWAVLGVSALVSIMCNALHAILPADQPLSPWLAGSLAAVAPAALLAITHGLTTLTRLRPAARTAAATTAGNAQHAAHATRADSGGVTPPSVAVTVPRQERQPEESAIVAAIADVDAAPAISAPVRVNEAPDAAAATGGPVAVVESGTVDTAVAAHPRWRALAPLVVARASLRDAGEDEVARVLHMGFEDALTNREIGRRMGMSHHTVGKIQTIGSQVLAEQQFAVA